MLTHSTHSTLTPTGTWTTLHTTPPRLFNTPQALHEALTTTNTWKALHTALNAPTPHTSQPHHNSEPVAGLRFTKKTPPTDHPRTTGTVIITPDGTLTIRAYNIPSDHWLTALQRLGTHLQQHTHPVQATTLTGLPNVPGRIDAMLMVTPDNRAACPAAWSLAADFLRVLATDTHPQP